MWRAALPALFGLAMVAGCGDSAAPQASKAASAEVPAAEPGGKADRLASVWDPQCPGDCQAAEKTFTPAFWRCMEEGEGKGGSTIGVNTCADEEYVRQNAALEETYRRLLSRASPERAARLRAAQAAWKIAAPLRANAAGSEHGTGSLSVIMAGQAALHTAAQRRLDLERFEAEGVSGAARP